MQMMIDRPPEIPAAVLQGVDLRPEYMDKALPTKQHAIKAESVKASIRRALFRQALFKVQNVEVMHDCKADRLIESVTSRPPGALLDLFAAPSIREELWTIERCQRKATYKVTYHREGNDGFSTRVVPMSWIDKLQLLRFNYA